MLVVGCASQNEKVESISSVTATKGAQVIPTHTATPAPTRT